MKPEPRPIRVLIVDDEPLARQRILDLLEKEQGVEIAGTVDSGPAAVEAIRRKKPDLLFLDVQMPGMSGLEVARAVPPEQMPATIFVTAYDRYALQAFEVAAVDYLVKPFDDDRFEAAFRRARKIVELEQVEQMNRRLMALLPPEEGAPSAYLERITVELRGQVRVVPVAKIDYITASGAYAELHVGEKTYAVRERMGTLEERLDPRVFFRTHRSAIVRVDRIDVLLRGSGGDYAVRLRNGVEVPLSRSRREELEQRLGIA
jgi:two-component system LytT family response regulator